MPLIIITGIPSSGKTTRTLELKKFFEIQHGKKVEIISEIDAIIKSGCDRNTLYADSKKEKAVRSNVRSSLEHQLNSKDILIIDGSNYIKGYRYELYCLSKSYKTPQCTIHCDIPIEHAWLLNGQRSEADKYFRETFDALVMRYESPDSKNRWDTPLFTVTSHDRLPFDDINRALYLVDVPKSNMSTQLSPVSSTNYLYELDRISQEIVNAIVLAGKIGVTNDISIPGLNLLVQRGADAAQLNRLRRQFLTYSKMHHIDVSQIAQLFVQYINKTL